MNVPNTILKTLEELGPMTATELAQCLPTIDPENLRRTCARMSQVSLRGKYAGTQRLHVQGWTHDAEGQRSYPRPIYAAGDGVNKARPKPKARKVVVRENLRRKKMHLTHNSVFNLGVRL